MAILLIMDSDRIHSNPQKDKVCYKRGDIVEVFEDSKPCVIPPSPPWLIIKVNGITKEQALKYMESWQSFSGLHPETGQPMFRMERRRKYAIRIDSLPAMIRNQILSNRYVEIDASQIANYLRNMETGVDGL